MVNWLDPRFPGVNGRLAWELKPGYPIFYQRARGWIKRSLRRGVHFDVVHQINPLAMRYPSPALGLGLNYIVGPLAGSLPTPAGFSSFARERLWFRKLRRFDRFRLGYDPWLRATYSGAAAVLGVAPYVEQVLAPCAPPRFEIMSETGVESVAEPRTRPDSDRPLRLIFVGRIIRTKGILDAIRAVAHASGKRRIQLDVLGTGDLLETCRNEAVRLGIADRVFFHGRVSREEVFEGYRQADVFFFPSFREPSGNVVFEALSQGLPVITSTEGGPGYVVDATCGMRVPPSDPESYPKHLADCIKSLASDPRRVAALSAGAIERMKEIALWPRKIERLIELYHDLVRSSEGARHPGRPACFENR